MLELAAITFGFLTNFVLLSVQRNNRHRRPCPPVMVYLGYLLVGICAGTAALLAGVALVHVALDTPLSSMLSQLPIEPVIL